ATQHLDAVLLRLALEGIGNTDAVGTRVIEDIDRLHLQVRGEEVCHIRALKGVGCNRTEINRPALGLELRRELRIGDIGIGRGRPRSGWAPSPCLRRSFRARYWRRPVDR